MLRFLEQTHGIYFVARIQLDTSVFQGIASILSRIAGLGVATYANRNQKEEGYGM